MDNNVNKGRQSEVDIAKALAIIYMVLVHTTEYYYNGENEIFEIIIEFLGSPPGAPVFMFALGIGIVYSGNNSSRSLFWRGVNLLVFSYVFNTVVYALPYFIVGDYKYALTEIMDIDILQFAGLTFIFMALAKRINIEWKQLLLVIVILQVANGILNSHEVASENYILSHIQGLFWWTCEDCYFPFFSWIAFPVAGYIFGQYLRQTTDKTRFYKRIGLVSAGISLGLYILGYIMGIKFGAYGALYQEEYYRMPLFANVLFVAFTIFCLAICYGLSCVLPKSVMIFAEKCSRNITYIYFLQYVLIIWIQVLLVGEENTFGSVKVLILSITYFVICFLLADKMRLYKKQKHQLFERKGSKFIL